MSSIEKQGNRSEALAPFPETKNVTLNLENARSECLENTEMDSSSTLNNISSFHREYLLKRHGTLDLDPIPCPSSADPYNWPTWNS